MTLRYDERGRPVGLDWTVISTTVVESKPVVEPKKKAKRAIKTPTRGPARVACSNDHLQAEHWRPNKNGDGGYCNACKTERARKYRESGKQREYRARKRQEQQKNGGA